MRVYSPARDRHSEAFRGPIPDLVWKTLCLAKDDTKVWVQPANPHGKKTQWYKSYEKYKHAKTFGELLGLGCRGPELTHDVLRGNIILKGPFRSKPACLDQNQTYSTLTENMIKNWSWVCCEANLQKLYKNKHLFDGTPLEGKATAQLKLLQLCEKMGTGCDLGTIIASSQNNGTNGIVLLRKNVDSQAKAILDQNKNITDRSVLDLLRQWGFKENQTRYNVMPENVKWIHSDNIGLLRKRGDQRPKVTATTKMYPHFWSLLCAYVKKKMPGFTCTSICLNKNYAAKPHKDKGNLGPSAIIALGSFRKGRLLYWDSQDDNSQKIDIRNNMILFNGNRTHAVEPYIGKERYSIVFFTVQDFRKTSSADMKWLKDSNCPCTTKQNVDLLLRKKC